MKPAPPVSIQQDISELSGNKRRKISTRPPVARNRKSIGHSSNSAKENRKAISPKKDKPQPAEKRLRQFRKRRPQSYIERLDRALTQRIFVLGRTRSSDKDFIPVETIEMAGTTGNIYHVRICLVPSCTCPDNRKGNQCKHIVYVLHNVLKAPEHLQYQLAFLSSELETIFSLAPPIPSSTTPASDTDDTHRKAIEGDCPICFMPFEPETEETVWCKTACGNNIHKTCFEQWARSQKSSGGGIAVRCVYCRSPWQGDEESISRVKSTGNLNDEGYVNIGDELGLSGERDYSTYHRPWVCQQFGAFY